ncbi:MAG TPA: hypothetical protein VEC60_20130, partial [Reyranella sp.]|nr:hypothetical protein [Reyranella sp.]
LDSPDSTIAVDRLMQLIVRMVDSEGDTIAVEGETTSLTPSLLAVTGVFVTALAPGGARVEARAGALADTLELALRPRVASVTLSDSSRVAPGDTMSVQVVVRDAGGAVLTGLRQDVRLNDPTGSFQVLPDGRLLAVETGTAQVIITVDSNIARPFTGTLFSGLRITHLVQGNGYSCGHTDLGLWCMGTNGFGQLGIGTTASAGGHWKRVADTTIVSVGPVMNAHTCGLDASGTVACWGRNHQWQTGSTSSINTLPFTVPGVPPLAAVGAGGDHSCGIEADGTTWCWGANLWGQMGRGTATTVQQPPGRVPGLTLARIAVGNLFTCGLDAAGAAWCWGRNADGQIGNGSTGPSVVDPTPVGGGNVFTDLWVGAAGACGLNAAGEAWCWGRPAADIAPSLPATVTPARWPAPAPLVQLAVGSGRPCALDAGGLAYCADQSQAFVPVQPQRRFSALTIRASAVCGRAVDDGRWYCWFSGGALMEMSGQR